MRNCFMSKVRRGDAHTNDWGEEHSMKMILMDFRGIPVLLGVIPLIFTSTDIADLCPFTSFCEGRGKQSPETWHQPNSCCLPCSCHRNCQLVGTCCHDAKLDGSLQQMYPCINQETIYKKYLSLQYASIKNSFVRVITDCNGDTINVSNETIFHCKKAVDIEDLIFVTGKYSGITYLNKHCAICNGENAVDVWNLYMVTDNTDAIFSAGASYKTRDEYLISTGLVMSTPPTDFAALSTYCKPHIYDKCNMTSEWDMYNVDTENACKASSAAFIDGNKRFLTIYKNPFCFVCNKSPRAFANLSNLYCDNILEILELRNTQYPLTTLIKGRPNEKLSDSRLTSPCRPGEVIDLFSGKCTKLFCPPGTVVIEDFCQPLFEDDSGIVMFVPFQVVIEDSITADQLQYELVLAELRSMIVSMTETRESRCKYCLAELAPIDGSLVFLVSFVSTGDCSYLQYIQRIANIYKQTPIKLFSQTIQGNITLDRLNITMHMFKNMFTPDYYPFIHDYNPNINGDCSSGTLFSEETIPCTSILISKSFIDALSLKITIKDEILSLGTHIDNGTLRVCLEEYNKIHALSSLASIACIYYIQLILTPSFLHCTAFVCT